MNTNMWRDFQIFISMPLRFDTDDIVTLLWFDITHRQTNTGHTGTNRLTETYKYILTLYICITLNEQLVDAKFTF